MTPGHRVAKSRLWTAALVASLLALVPVVSAQLPGLGWGQDFGRGRQFRGGYGRFRRVPPRFAKSDSFDGSFNFCRIMYDSDRFEEGGQGWSTDYPDADSNLMIRLSELTKTPVSMLPGEEPNHLVVQMTDSALFQCPFTLMSDVGTISLSDSDAEQLRTYLLKGGFLWVDDFWGTEAWEHWASEFSKVLAPDKYPIRDLTLDHAIHRSLFEIGEVPQIPSIQFWRRSGGHHSERGVDSANVHFRGVSDPKGRLMVVMSHNTDISDAWEREGEDTAYFYAYSVDGYAVALNVVIYAMTH